MKAVSDVLKQPLLWAGLGAAILIGLIVAVARSGDDNTELTDPSVTTSTVGDITDDRAQGTGLTATVGDIGGSPRPPGLTDTVLDAEAFRGGPRGAQPIIDELEQCLWLVDIAGENPAKLFIAAWPSGTEISWDPFEARVPGQVQVLNTGTRVVGDAIVVDTADQLSGADVDRLLGMDDCEHDGLIVFGASPGSVTLEPSS